MIEEVLDEVEYFEMQDHDLPCSGSSLLKSAMYFSPHAEPILPTP